MNFNVTGVLCTVDVHAVPKRCGANSKHGIVVTTTDSTTAIPAREFVQLFDDVNSE